MGNPATSSRHALHTPASSAARRSTRASPTASTADPAAIDDSDTGSSHPCGAKTYSLIMSRSGSSPDTACRVAIAATPDQIPTYPNRIPMAHHDGRGDGGGPSEIHPSRP
ncbi:hypothetical protein MPTA5024_34485 [Microbispora sp. ATCC PTA-5024]|nr:hypothetical protein MPTA5024_34485 [Microbispora sp. ATCC PTA-5024]